MKNINIVFGILEGEFYISTSGFSKTVNNKWGSIKTIMENDKTIEYQLNDEDFRFIKNYLIEKMNNSVTE